MRYSRRVDKRIHRLRFRNTRDKVGVDILYIGSC